ncbi:MAG: hypothetical protein A2007_05735 [Verrucomicrobia bacterium GWC2_42_7]|nr:MAG: hypothetical protein A2007_05735 [Verrucomicrobia bacterium GWC2_42_7]
MKNKIKLFACDVDGVLTDGSITYSDNGVSAVEIKSFNSKDGLGLALLHKKGIKTAFITARTSEAVKRRASELHIDHVCQGVSDKGQVLKELMDLYKVSSSEVAYVGDDLPDLPALLLSGFPCCPADAVEEVKKVCKYVSSFNGGRGAIRQICDMVRG